MIIPEKRDYVALGTVKFSLDIFDMGTQGYVQFYTKISSLISAADDADDSVIKRSLIFLFPAV